MLTKKDYLVCLCVILQFCTTIAQGTSKPESTISPSAGTSTESNLMTQTTSSVSLPPTPGHETSQPTNPVSENVTTTITISPTGSESSTTNTTGVSDSPTPGQNETSQPSNPVSETVSNTTTVSPTGTESTTTITTAIPAPPSNVLTVLFVNDMQYDLFPVRSDNGNVCTAADNATECSGGVGRLGSYIKSKMKINPNTLWLNAGNTVGGPWFKTLKYRTALQAMNFLNFTVLTVGPQVFEFGREASDEFLTKLSPRAVVSNIDSPSVSKSGQFSTGNCNVSVIGFADQSIFGNVTDAAEALQTEINETRSTSPHVVTIALGSSSREGAKQLADSVDGIDMLLYSGDCVYTGTEDDRVCKDKTDDNATYVYSLAMNHSDPATRFLVAELQVTLGDNCSVDNVTYSYHDYSNETEDSWVWNLTQDVADLDAKLTDNTKNLSGDIETCSRAECSLGDLVADSMLAALGGDMWSEDAARIAVFPAMMLQVNATLPTGELTAEQLYSLIPQDAFLYTVLLTGLQLKEMFTISLNSDHQFNSTDLLHVSSLLQVQYNRTDDDMLNVAAINSVPDTSDTMKLQPLDLDTLHCIVVPHTFMEMSSYRKLITASSISYHNVTVVEAVIRFINNTKFLMLPVVGNRQQELQSFVIAPRHECPSYEGTTILVTLVVTAIVLGGCYGVWWYVFRRRRGRSSSTMAMMHLDYGSS